MRCLAKTSKNKKKLGTLLDLCVSSLRRGHANLLCIVPILTDAPQGSSGNDCANKLVTANNTPPPSVAGCLVVATRVDNECVPKHASETWRKACIQDVGAACNCPGQRKDQHSAPQCGATRIFKCVRCTPNPYDYAEYVFHVRTASVPA